MADIPALIKLTSPCNLLNNVSKETIQPASKSRVALPRVILHSDGDSQRLMKALPPNFSRSHRFGAVVERNAQFW